MFICQLSINSSSVQSREPHKTIRSSAQLSTHHSSIHPASIHPFITHPPIHSSRIHPSLHHPPIHPSRRHPPIHSSVHHPPTHAPIHPSPSRRCLGEDEDIKDGADPDAGDAMFFAQHGGARGGHGQPEIRPGGTTLPGGSLLMRAERPAGTTHHGYRQPEGRNESLVPAETVFFVFRFISSPFTKVRLGWSYDYHHDDILCQ